jgi:hypothetical protein
MGKLEMSWHQYLTLHCVVAAVGVFLGRRLYRGRLGRLLRVSLGAGALAFFIDYPAEDRMLWSFEAASYGLLLKVPLENILVISSSVPYLIAVYLGWEKLLGHEVGPAKNQARVTRHKE